MNLPWWLFYATRKKRAASANVICESHQGNLLVVKAKYKPYWSLPGGWIDRNESPRDAAIRELHEEIGLEVRAEELELASVINRISRRADTYLFVFRLKNRLDENVELKLQPSEIAGYDWVSKQDIRQKRQDRHYNRAPKNWAADSPETYLENRIN